jgi:hypothetical protein
MYIEETPYEKYERELHKKKQDHLRRVRDLSEPTIYTNDNKPYMASPCAHDQCPSCHGTGVTINGGGCIHNLVCSCRKCSVRC